MVQEQHDNQMVLGGWVSSSNYNHRTDATVVVGYCLEKISNGFQVLRQMTAWDRELFQTTRKTRLTDLRSGATHSNSEREQKRKAVDSLKQAIKSFQEQDDLRALRKLADNLEMLTALPFTEKALLFLLFVKRNGTKRTENQNIALNVLASAANAGELRQLLEFGGGRNSIQQMMQCEVLGRFLFLLEKFGIDPWTPPFQKDIFTNSSESAPEIHPEKMEKPALNGAVKLIHKEYLSAFLNGKINPSAIIGLSRPELYRIAERAYKMLQAGRLDIALQVFDALVYLEPNDPYYYTALGSVRQQLNDPEGSMYCYFQAIQLQPHNVSSLADRGEIFFGQGKLTEALEDFQKVLQLDPSGANPSTLRVRFLLAQLNQALNKTEKANSQIETVR